MRQFTRYISLALAACLSLFCIPSFADPIAHAYKLAYVAHETQGVAQQRLELTLAMWRSGVGAGDSLCVGHLRASSNHFEMVTAKPKPEGVSFNTAEACMYRKAWL